MKYKEYKKSFEKSNYLQYWIINKKEESIFTGEQGGWSNVYGPFSEEDYGRKREEMQVPENLNFIKERNYKTDD